MWLCTDTFLFSECLRFASIAYNNTDGSSEQQDHDHGHVNHQNKTVLLRWPGVCFESEDALLSNLIHLRKILLPADNNHSNNNRRTTMMMIKAKCQLDHLRCQFYRQYHPEQPHTPQPQPQQPQPPQPPYRVIYLLGDQTTLPGHVRFQEPLPIVLVQSNHGEENEDDDFLTHQSAVLREYCENTLLPTTSLLLDAYKRALDDVERIYSAGEGDAAKVIKAAAAAADDDDDPQSSSSSMSSSLLLLLSPTRFDESWKKSCNPITNTNTNTNTNRGHATTQCNQSGRTATTITTAATTTTTEYANGITSTTTIATTAAASAIAVAVVAAAKTPPPSTTTVIVNTEAPTVLPPLLPKVTEVRPNHQPQRRDKAAAAAAFSQHQDPIPMVDDSDDSAAAAAAVAPPPPPPPIDPKAFTFSPAQMNNHQDPRQLNHNHSETAQQQQPSESRLEPVPTNSDNVFITEMSREEQVDEEAFDEAAFCDNGDDDDDVDVESNDDENAKAASMASPPSVAAFQSPMAMSNHNHNHTDSVKTSSSNKSCKSKKKKRMIVDYPPPEGSAAVIEKQQKLHSIPTFGKVQPILEKAGFMFSTNSFHRPTTSDAASPSSSLMDTDAIMNVGMHFSNQVEFRKDLCAYGLCDCSDWTSKERETVGHWVKYTFVNDVAVRSSNDQYRVLSPSEFREYHERLGISTDDGIYTLPTRSPAECTILIGVKSFIDHLSRFGLPCGCTINALTEEELLSFFIYVADSSTPFEPKDRCETTSTGGRSRRASTARNSLGGMSSLTPSAAAKRSLSTPLHVSTSTPATKSASRVVRSQKRHVCSSDNSACKEPRLNLNQALMQSQATRPEMTEQELDCLPVVVETPAQETAISPLISRVSSRNEDRLDTRTCREHLQRCINLSGRQNLDGTSPNLFYVEGSLFHKDVEKIDSFVQAVLKSEGQHGLSSRSSASLYICGGPGLGKSLAVNTICKKWEKECLTSKFKHPKLRVCYINATHMQGSGELEDIVLQRLAETLGMQVRQPSINSIKTKLRKRHLMLVLVVDELDSLLSDRNSSDVSFTTAHEDALREMGFWARDEDLPLAFIGISNRKGSEKYERLKLLGGFQDSIDFKAYTKEDISYILGSLMSTSVVAPPAIEFIATKASHTRGGDLRFVLNTIQAAANLCLSTLPASVLDSVPNPAKPAIGMLEIHRTFQAENKRFKDIIDGLPSVGKGMLVMLVTLAQENIQNTTIRNLKRFVTTAIGNELDALTSLEDFVAILSTICDSGLVVLEGGGSLDSMPNCDIANSTVKLGLSLEEVTDVVNDELCKKHRVYADLRDQILKTRDMFFRSNEPIVANWRKRK